MRLLVNAGADLSEVTHSGMTAVDIAESIRDREMFDLLKSLG